MSNQDDPYMDEPIPLELSDDTPVESKPSAVGEDLFKSAESERASAEPSRHIQAIDNKALGHRSEGHYKRALDPASHGATRIRTFHGKLSDAAMIFMDQQINEWIDSHPDVEVKFCTSTIGMVEGKRQEPHLIISVWY